jgi:hypothetical protein
VMRGGHTFPSRSGRALGPAFPRGVERMARSLARARTYA